MIYNYNTLIIGKDGIVMVHNEKVITSVVTSEGKNSYLPSCIIG